MREMLIELMRQVDACICNLCDGGEEPFNHSAGILADHLLDNGVVVREKGEWEYTEDIDEDGNIQAYCSACGAGDKHATSMVGKVPYCWKCGADMRKGENG